MPVNHSGDTAPRAPQVVTRFLMLYLSRKVGESIVINDNIEITVVEVRGRSIKLGITFPPDVTVLRRELYDRIQAENRAAAGARADLLGKRPDEDTPDEDQ